ncbi:MAG: hypothetical protein KAT05_13055 [Spirochaetes bacterium]|nr:hypothetical protein [Spirochaetota bacterium]
MNTNYAMITDIAFLNSKGRDHSDFSDLFSDNLFSDEKKWNNFQLSNEITGLMDNINSRKKYFMSKLSLGVYNVLEKGPAKNLKEDDEIYLFSGFSEIETINKIGNKIMIEDYSINPALFPNSVHHISLCYFTILKKIYNYCTTITDGLLTNFSFINFIKNRIKLEGDFVVVTGEENSNFFEYEINNVLNIVPSFASYKIIPDSKKGFCFAGVVNNIDQLKKLKIYKKSDAIFVDKETFFDLKIEKNKNIYCEYPIVLDNPCGIVFRLAFPFYFNIKGTSIVIDKIKGKYYYFEVNI